MIFIALKPAEVRLIIDGLELLADVDPSADRVTEAELVIFRLEEAYARSLTP